MLPDKIERNGEYLQAVLVKAGGMAIFTLAFLKLPDALADLIRLVSTLWLRVSMGEVEGMKALLANAVHVSVAGSIGNLLGFVILLFTARWIFSYPKILRNWFQKTDDAFSTDEGKEV